MKGKDAARLEKLVALYEKGPHLLSRSERRQLRKLVARDENLGRGWRSSGHQTRSRAKRDKASKPHGRHARTVESREWAEMRDLTRRKADMMREHELVEGEKMEEVEA